MLNLNNPQVAHALAVMAETARLLERDTHTKNNPCDATAKAAAPPEPEPDVFETAVIRAMGTGLRKAQAVRKIAIERPELHRDYLRRVNANRAR